MSRRLLILGSTGSIGTQALDIVGRSDDLELVGLCAESSCALLLEQARAHGVGRIALADEAAAARAAEEWTDGEVLAGPDGLVRLVTDSGADLVLNALVGAAGLGPTVATLGEGIDLALANKESLVVGGELVTQLAEATGAQLIPVDSEHSALFQLIGGEPPGTVERLVLTASGGPFRGRSRSDLEGVTVEQALAHPTWDMGGKITIDSATLMNKGLELIEAHHLFGVPYEQIDVVVHPQSIVHSLIHLIDGASLAHLGYPDMRVPIAYALHHPERVDVPVRTLDLAEVGSLTFEPVDTEAFPCLRLAREAATAGGTAPCVLNAANEVAVHAFLDGRLAFLGIAEVIERALDRLGAATVHSFDSLYQADREAREAAAELRRRDSVSWLLTFVGFSALIVLHEFGHFAAAKAVGMRVERFALFFPPLIFKVRRGETEYGIGSIPLGGYVRITGMNPNEEIAPEVADRAYYRQPVWKRILVISAGPAMNVLIAFLILWGLFVIKGQAVPTDKVAPAAMRAPAAGALKAGDEIVSIDGRDGGPEELRRATRAHRCAGPQRDGCVATTPATVVVRRHGRLLTLRLRPRYDASGSSPGMRIGFAFDERFRDVGPGEAVSLSVSGMWRVTKGTVSALARIFDSEKRKQISGVVGTSDTLQKTINYDVVQALVVLAIISLSLAIVNLFPFLPLDGGHIFWALAEKVSGRRIPFSVMERASVIGFLLVIMLFFIGLSNDIDRLRGEGFGVR